MTKEWATVVSSNAVCLHVQLANDLVATLLVLSQLSKPGLDYKKCKLDRIEVGRVWGQIFQLGAFRQREIRSDESLWITENANDLDSISSLISGALCIAQLSMTMTDRGRGKRFILSRRPEMNSVKSLVLKAPWTTTQSTMPSTLIAGKREYLDNWGITRLHARQHHHDQLT